MDISFNQRFNVSGTASTAAIYYNGIFNVDNADGELRTYMTAKVHIILGQADNALLIPADGLAERNSDSIYTVYVL